MDQATLFYWAVAGSIAMFIGSLVLLPIVVVLLPVDFFTRGDEERFARLRDRHPVWRYSLLAVKNTLGVLLLLAGLVMLVTPGQGVLAILAGITLLDLPGKRELERKILGRPSLQKAMNAIRQKAGKPAFEMPLI